MFIETEQTPNPATLKFLPGRSVMAPRYGRFRLLPTRRRIRPSLGQRLFQLEGVAGVFWVRISSPSARRTARLGRC